MAKQQQLTTDRHTLLERNAKVRKTFEENARKAAKSGAAQKSGYRLGSPYGGPRLAKADVT